VWLKSLTDTACDSTNMRANMRCKYSLPLSYPKTEQSSKHCHFFTSAKLKQSEPFIYHKNDFLCQENVFLIVTKQFFLDAIFFFLATRSFSCCKKKFLRYEKMFLSLYQENISLASYNISDTFTLNFV